MSAMGVEIDPMATASLGPHEKGRIAARLAGVFRVTVADAIDWTMWIRLRGRAAWRAPEWGNTQALAPVHQRAASLRRRFACRRWTDLRKGES